MFPIPLQRTLAISSLVYAATLWGVMWYPYRLLNEAGVGGIASSFFTYAVPLLALGWLHGRELRRARSQWMWLIALGLAAGWTNLAYVLAMLEGEVVRVLLLFFLSPLWTVVFARFLLHEKLNRAGWAVMVLAAGGAMVMLWQPNGDLPLPTNRAEWLALSAGMVFALSNVISRHLSGVTEGAKSVSIWVGVAVLTVTGLWLFPGELDFVEGAEWSVWLLLFGVGIAIGSMTYAVQYGLARVPANQAIVIFLFELVVAAVAAYFLSMERMGLQEWVGAIMIITASLFSGHMEDDQVKEKRHV
ncbi:DMT family transporter [Thiobacillus denitrificans]|uniref:Permease of the drug/metabolite transporter (DMT) superfamily n=1 Tax=Thiobacillus denitrificans TaxID=36861 RepID=A0A119CVF4_THIDE|nr:DMT family transporter [Thiobacillus denitrificans]KVW94953.1 permease of the drug/metabolite transporter (DMT) superfamily [Thiobacillus denitrificans]